ncbi:uncharacterized protein [Nicotiana sylvestris]|uniref:uncharacterized protein n=1 Tax=Nicotiana sylvestris TaxID=4096 RepID=UPI00388CCF49
MGRGRHRGGGQTRRGQPATAQTGGGQPAGAPARFYAIPARPNALASDVVIIGSTYSYGSSLFSHFRDIPSEPLGTPIHVSTPVGDYVVVDWIYRSCVVIFCNFETRADLILLDMIDFEVILGMNCLSPYHTVLYFHAKTVTLAIPELPSSSSSGVRRCVSSDLPGMPPDRDIDFYIDFAPGTQPIPIPPYRMAPKDLKELKEQHEEYLAKRLTQKGALFRWFDDCDASFQKLKTALTTTPVIVLPFSLGMYTALYGRRCCSPIEWFEPCKSKLYGIDLVKDALEKVKLIQERLRTAQSRQKSYADQKACDVSFMVGEKVLLKVSPIKGIVGFGRKGKLRPRFIGPFEALRQVGEVVYELTLPPSLSGVHPMFHVSMIRTYYADLSHVLDFSTIHLDESLGYEEEPVAIVDRQDR